MTPEAAPSPRRETLFRQEAPGGVTYRIPALLYLPPAATFLAFAEKRASARDEDAQHLVLRRGRRRGAAVEWGPVEELPELTLPGHRTMNPCPVYEAAGGAVLLLCICVRGRVTEGRQLAAGRCAARLCCAASGDGGRSWAPLRDVTGQAAGAELARWATFAVGPGHGVQLAAGRLAVPAYAYYVRRRLCGVPLPCCTRPRALLFYSDDGGRSWRRGEPVPGRPTGECQVAEVTGHGDTVLYCSARTPRRCRAAALSLDRGSRFGPASRCRRLREPPGGCQGSVVSFAAPAGAWPTNAATAITNTAAATTNTIANTITNTATNTTTHNTSTITKTTINTTTATTNTVTTTTTATTNTIANTITNTATNTTTHNTNTHNTSTITNTTTNTTTATTNTIADTTTNTNTTTITNTTNTATNTTNNTNNTNNTATTSTTSWLLYSHPTDKRRRRDLGIYLNPSPLDPAAWRPPWLLYQGPCGYSDLAVCPEPDPLFGCLFECGGASGCEEIAFCLFTLRQLLDACGRPADKAGTG
ncbi:sialidase-3 [Struthio camelus]|uniref:sialidase-3 n=1 Tax=Struthio camelus TaxID=8801 RepID=UPI003603B9CB